jgi:hypothetical protein
MRLLKEKGVFRRAPIPRYCLTKLGHLSPIFNHEKLSNNPGLPVSWLHKDEPVNGRHKQPGMVRRV